MHPTLGQDGLTLGYGYLAPSEKGIRRRKSPNTRATTFLATPTQPNTKVTNSYEFVTFVVAVR